MTKYREILRMANESFSQRQIATTLRISRTTVRNTLTAAKEQDLSWHKVQEGGLEESQVRALLYPQKLIESDYEQPDCEYIEKEVRKVGVTLQLLWLEYCDRAHANGKRPYMYSRYCDYYRAHSQKNRATMHIKRTPGKEVEVDWAGKTGYLKDPVSGELIPVYIFVAAMSYSQYSYAEGFLSMDIDAWITANIHLFEFLGGVPKTVIPDNLKTGIKKPSYCEPDIQANYQELAEHYSTFILPARIKRPRDKPNVESSVNNLANKILGKIRNQTFFTLEEFNEEVWKYVDIFNTHAFQKKTGSRATLFAQEQDLLTHLPKTRYEMATWKVATVQPNYHISVDGMFYSVPFQYISQKLNVKSTSSLIEIFKADTRITSHQRLQGRKGQYQTERDHMPKKHQKYLEWDEDRFLSWAENIGSSTRKLIQLLLAKYAIPQQGFRSCFGILKLGDNGNEELLEQASAKVLSYTDTPSYKLVKTVFKKMKNRDVDTVREADPSIEHAFIRNLRGDVK